MKKDEEKMVEKVRGVYELKVRNGKNGKEG